MQLNLSKADIDTRRGIFPDLESSGVKNLVIHKVLNMLSSYRIDELIRLILEELWIVEDRFIFN